MDSLTVKFEYDYIDKTGQSQVSANLNSQLPQKEIAGSMSKDPVISGSEFQDGVAFISTISDSHYLIDNKGNLVSGMPFTTVGRFENGVARVRIGGDKFFIDRKGVRIF